jgi:vacuolar-type H+-ATPase subunit H
LKNELLLIKSEEKNTNKLIDEVNQRRATILQEIIKKADFLRNEIDIAMVELTEELDSQQKVDETLLGNRKNKVKSSIRSVNACPLCVSVTQSLHVNLPSFSQ